MTCDFEHHGGALRTSCQSREEKAATVIRWRTLKGAPRTRDVLGLKCTKLGRLFSAAYDPIDAAAN
jgi:hypothetical protein